MSGVQGLVGPFAEVPRFVWITIAFLALAWFRSFWPERPRGNSPGATSTLGPPRSVVLEAPAPRQAAPSPPPASAPAPAWTAARLRELDPARLERLVLAFWQAHHFKAERATVAPGGGTMLLIHRPATGALFAVAQCSPARAGQVGLLRLRAFAELVQARGAALGLFYGLGGFAPDGVEFAKGHKLKPIGPEELLAEINKLRTEQQHALAVV